MSKELYLHTLQQIRDGCLAENMDTEAEALEAAIQALSCNGDCISRQAAIDAIITLWADKPFGNPALTEIKECVERVPSAQSEQQWIPCSERLPEEDGDYWVTADPRYVPPQYKSTDIILWSNGKWMMADYFILDGEGRKMPEYNAVEVDIPIIAWMPLPEPYKEKDNERA